MDSKVKVDINSLKKNTVIGVVKTDDDLNLAMSQKIYRIPANSVGNSISKIALDTAYSLGFYQTNNIKNGLQNAIEFYGIVSEIEHAKRSKYLDDIPAKNNDFYYFIKFSEVHNLLNPIISLHKRRVTFVRTNHDLMLAAQDFNDLIIGSKSEEILFDNLKKIRANLNINSKELDKIYLERKYYMKLGDENVIVDFAIFNAKRNVIVNVIDEKTDIHFNGNNLNDIKSNYTILEFTPADIESDLAECLSKIHNSLLLSQ